jgi:hypothetical protein
VPQWLFLGGVCKTWAAAVIHQPQEHKHDDAVVATQAKTTRFSAFAESASRIIYACECDKSFKTRHLLAFSKAAVSHGCSDAMRWCELQAGVVWRKWHQALVLAAVGSNQLATAQQLLESQAEWDVASVAECAARSKLSDIAMLQWALT